MGSSIPTCTPAARSWPSAEEVAEARAKWNPLVTALIDREGYEPPSHEPRSAEKRGGHTRLDGMTICIKDNTDIAGMPTSAGSSIFPTTPATRTAEAVARLVDGGARIVGKSNLHEFAHGPSTANEHLGTCRNPWDLERIPGGSSGGTGAAIAAGMCSGGIGTDTSGSVLLPSSLCGITGLRPPVGATPTTGVVPLSARFDTVGPMARSVVDVARMYAEIAFPPSQCHCELIDSLSPDRPRPLEGMTIGLIDAFFDDVDAGIVVAVREAADGLANAGARIVELSAPPLAEVGPHVRTVVFADAARFYRQVVAEHADKLEAETRRRLEVGRKFTSGEYLAAVAGIRSWAEQIQGLLRTEADVLLSPSVPTAVPRINQPVQEIGATIARMTLAIGAAGVAAMSVPAGFVDGLPVGLTLATTSGLEARIFRAGAVHQDRTDHHLKRPTLPAAAGAGGR